MTRYFRNIWNALTSVPASMSISGRAAIDRPVTLQYPDEKWTLPPRARGQLHNNVDDCIGCGKCASACPVDCIHIETMKAGPDEDLGKTSKDTPKRLHILVFDIDMAKCCYCGLCTFPCPTECLTMTPRYEASVYRRQELVYHYSPYSAEQARALVEKARERDGAKFSIIVTPKKCEKMLKERRGLLFTEPFGKPYPGALPKPAPAAPPPPAPPAEGA